MSENDRSNEEIPHFESIPALTISRIINKHHKTGIYAKTKIRRKIPLKIGNEK